MAIAHRWARRLQRQCQQSLATVTSNLQKNNLWKNILKNTICTTLNLIIGILPAVIAVYGRSTYLGAMASVFGHPGRRFGQMTEVLILILLGVFVGIAWSSLGLYLSSLAYKTNVEAAWAIRAVFFALALVLHGVLRSWAPRLFMFVFFLLLVTLTILTSTATSVSTSMVTQIVYPILTASGLIVLVNIAIFPEFSSGFLGRSTIEVLSSTIGCFQEAGDWFMSDSKGADGKEADKEKHLADLRAKLVALTDKKSKLRTQLGNSKKAQAECNFELVFAVLPPRSLKPISVTLMSRLVQITICLINACESKYALTGYGHEEDDPESPEEKDSETDESDSDSNSDTSSSESSSESDDGKSEHKSKKARRKSKHIRNIELVKPIREIESGDIDLLEHICSQVRGPAKILENQMQAAVRVIASTLAYCYDVPKLPSGSPAPSGIVLEEIDIRIEVFTMALLQFDQDSAQALEHAASMAYGQESQGDIMPRMETHLISSFLISLRQAAAQVMDMLKYSRTLVERRQTRNNRRRLYWPKISWKKWLASGGEDDVNALPENARKEARAGHGLREEPPSQDDDPNGSDEQLLRHSKDEELGHTISKQSTHPEKGKIPRRKGPLKSEASNVMWLRGLAADTIEFFVDSDDLSFALKMSVAAFIVTWPAFVPTWNAWYNSVRGSWASLQLILVFEVSVGTSFQGFILRVFGVIFGCVIGFLAYEIGQGNRVVAIVILVIGIIPSSYIHLGTPYVKTGIISIVSMSVVALATILQQPVNETWAIFVQRMVCFLIGGTVALLVEMLFFPVRARDRLVESLASSIQQISQMEASLAVGIDSPMNLNIQSHALNENFAHSKEKAEQALAAARTFLPFCLTEPRMKGSFKGQALIYGEIIYVLFQIIDRMDNMLHIRKAYGSSLLEELNTEVLPYRRNIAASIALTLFAVHEALTTRLPLPQFLPSSRVAQLRYISRVRELLLERSTESARNSGIQTPVTIEGSSMMLHAQVLKSMTRQNFLSWNASSAGQMEIIEYLEELVDLSKLLVGVNAFRSGMLERPKFYEYVNKIKNREPQRVTATISVDTEQESTSQRSNTFGRRRRGFSFRKTQSHGTGTGTGIGLGIGTGIGDVLRRRQTTDIRGVGDAAADRDDNEDTIADDLPMSLQRVMTKRKEGRRSSRRDSDDPKGKRPLQPSKTWCP
ncbi:hypothetical protein F5B20DRAFT_535492 [Whalleya microplaca]|nr:hypothetical protein F5B20DRAFT_535492 [Whalleya microplaca]